MRPQRNKTIELHRSRQRGYPSPSRESWWHLFLHGMLTAPILQGYRDVFILLTHFIRTSRIKNVRTYFRLIGEVFHCTVWCALCTVLVLRGSEQSAVVGSFKSIEKCFESQEKSRSLPPNADFDGNRCFYAI